MRDDFDHFSDRDSLWREYTPFLRIKTRLSPLPRNRENIFRRDLFGQPDPVIRQVKLIAIFRHFSGLDSKDNSRTPPITDYFSRLPVPGEMDILAGCL